ncbi:MAG: hypothetical protein A4S09_11140 [Proteobacteria bacterium SG_bin7]|nr:MAG: hypothetical protein A4S09_11140 [Proteobacteria bacterium SG_bin7]
MLKALLAIFFLFLSASRSQNLTLKEALKLVPKHPKQYTSSLDTASAQITKTKSYLKLSPSFSGSWQKSSLTTVGNLNNPIWSISADLNLFNSFGDFSNIRAKSYSLNAAEAAEEWSLNKNELALAEIYLKCLYAQNSETAALEAYNIAAQIADIEKSRFNKGIKSRDDYLKLKVDAENRRISYLTETTNKENCYAELFYWVGNFSALSDPKLNPREPAAKISLPENHPRLRTARNFVDAKKSTAAAVVSSNLPKLNLSLTRSYNEITTSSLPAETYSNSIFLTASWNFFDSGQTLSDIRLIYIDIEKSEASLKETERDLTRELTSQAKNLSQYLSQYKIAEENLRDIQVTFKTSLARFRAGAISANEVALDQARVVAATSSVYNSWLQMNLSYLRYQSSLGNNVSEVLQR